MIDGPKPDWLPELVLFCGNWESYEEKIYSIFLNDFVKSKPSFAGKPVNRKRYPEYKGKDFAFWHLVSEGAKEEERIPDLRRCERIRWPRAIIDRYLDIKHVKTWKNKRGTEIHICLWLEAHEHLVVLAERKAYYLLKTSYPVFEEHRKKKLRKEYDSYLKKLAPP